MITRKRTHKFQFDVQSNTLILGRFRMSFVIKTTLCAMTFLEISWAYRRLRYVVFNCTGSENQYLVNMASINAKCGEGRGGGGDSYASLFFVTMSYEEAWQLKNLNNSWALGEKSSEIAICCSNWDLSKNAVFWTTSIVGLATQHTLVQICFCCYGH